MCADEKTTEAEDTKQESRTKPSYFTQTRKMSFFELVYLYPASRKRECTSGTKTVFCDDRERGGAGCLSRHSVRHAVISATGRLKNGAGNNGRRISQ